MNRIFILLALCMALLCSCTINSRPPSYQEDSPVSPDISSAHPASTPEPVIEEIIQAEEAVEETPSQPELQAEEVLPEPDPETAVSVVEEAQPLPDAPAQEPAAALQTLDLDTLEPEEPQAPDLDAEEIEQHLLDLINQERVESQVAPLEMDEAMLWAARIRAPEVMDGLSHTRTDDTPYYTAFDEAGFSYAGRFHGENVSYMYFPAGSYTSAEAAQQMFDRLAESSGHYLNMLSANFDLAGIGIHIYQDGDTVYIYSAQLFASR